MQYFLFVYNTKVPKWNLKKEIAHLPIIYSVEEDNKKTFTYINLYVNIQI